jgi:hypothetical protein
MELPLGQEVVDQRLPDAQETPNLFDAVRQPPLRQRCFAGSYGGEAIWPQPFRAIVFLGESLREFLASRNCR